MKLARLTDLVSCSHQKEKAYRTRGLDAGRSTQSGVAVFKR